MKAWLILLSKEILFLSHMCIHNHLDHIKWCKMEKDMPLQKRGPLKTKAKSKTNTWNLHEQTHGNLSSSIKFMTNGQHVNCVQTGWMPKLNYFSYKNVHQT
jgi:hypothetical protein